MDEIERNIQRLIRRVEGAEERIVDAGAQVQYEHLKENLPVDKGDMQKKLIVGQPYLENGKTFINIGWPEGSNVEFRAHFPEWGTVHQKPQLKITKSVKESHDAKVKAMLAVMRKEYGLNV
ncbi:HK97-gp10 family putative phage morphogenesis protein [Macrococcus bovicus]|uniref:HK97-gp10 family putative phage morphogenesis protein n=1 Tax=Macrococcus bovicus TaxID=69968 RepID=UPI0025A5B2DE|nr:HK97-gp10 family putative phage morphogenesis protein [Macrococcus bovicus]WJP97066.1 HK97 gp10 family phage protein [Macrococcus bovicus]